MDCFTCLQYVLRLLDHVTPIYTWPCLQCAFYWIIHSFYIFCSFFLNLSTSEYMRERKKYCIYIFLVLKKNWDGGKKNLTHAKVFLIWQTYGSEINFEMIKQKRIIIKMKLRKKIKKNKEAKRNWISRRKRRQFLKVISEISSLMNTVYFIK